MALNKNIKAFFCGSLSALLGFVIVFNLSFNAFHAEKEEHHQHAEQNCSVDEEFDACHRFLIHHEKSAGCDGSHQHITNKTDDCFVCNFFKHQQQIIETKNEVCLLTKRALKVFSITETHLTSSFPVHVFLRGPPPVS